MFDRPLDPVLVWQVVPPTLTQSKRPWVYGVDGKWHKRLGVTLIHRDVINRETIWWSKAKSESYQALFTDGYQLVQQLQAGDNSLPTGAVSDWKGSMVAMVKTCFGNIPHQRCQAHTDRDLKRLLPKHSPIMASQELRKIGLGIKTIETRQDLEGWLTWLNTWEVIFGDHLTKRSYQDPDPELRSHHQRRRWWYTHKNLRRAFRILTVDQDNMFIYLKDPLIPKTNNSLEGLNSDIKGKLHEHRGIPYDYQYAFVTWLLGFKRIENKQQLRQLWANWVKAK